MTNKEALAKMIKIKSDYKKFTDKAKEGSSLPAKTLWQVQSSFILINYMIEHLEKKDSDVVADCDIKIIVGIEADLAEGLAEII